MLSRRRALMASREEGEEEMKDYELVYEKITEEEVKIITTDVLPANYKEIIILVNTVSGSGIGSHLDFVFAGRNIRIDKSLHETQRRNHVLKVNKIGEYWFGNISYGYTRNENLNSSGINSILDKLCNTIISADFEDKNIKVEAYQYSEATLIAGTHVRIYAR